MDDPRPYHEPESFDVVGIIVFAVILSLVWLMLS